MADRIIQPMVLVSQNPDVYDSLIINKALNATNAINAIFDKTIRTQQEFEAIVASPTALGAKSVALIGDGGTLEFTLTTNGWKLPSTLKQIFGFNNAKIKVNNFAYSNTNRAGVWYETLPTSRSYCIQNLIIECISMTSNSEGVGFFNCTQLTNCTSSSSAGVGYGSSSVGFYMCTQLTNCTSTGSSVGAAGYGFDNCIQLTNCTSSNSTGFGGGYGFFRCTQLTNCVGIGTGTGAAGYGFNECVQLTNCTGTGVGANGYGFYNCWFSNGCKESATLSTAGIWGGTNLFRDDDSCQITR